MYYWNCDTIYYCAVTETHFPNGCFSMSAFARLKVLTDIDVQNELDIHTLVQQIQYRHNTPNSCAEVFEEWLAGQSPLAPTWENLLQVLRDLNREDLAKHIEQFFQSPTESKKKASEVMGEEKELVDSLQQTLAKVERDLYEKEEEHKMALEEIEVLKAENESLSTEIEALRQQQKQLPSVKPTGMSIM